MTLNEAKMTIYANVVYACEKAEFPPMTIKMVKDACDTVIELAEQADTPQTDCKTCKYGQDKHRYAHICNECGVGINNYTPQTDEEYINNLPWTEKDCPWK